MADSKTHLFIVNDSPYGNERPYNAWRLALNLVKRPDTADQSMGREAPG